MKAAVYRGKDEVRVETLPVPRIGQGEVLVRVESCGVCGTDIKKIQFATVAPPRIFGHEIAGVVARTGAGVRRWRVGDRVVVHHHVACERCLHCRRGQFTECGLFARTGTTAGFEPAGGGFAQFVRVMPWVVKAGLVRIPDGVTFDEACMLEPVNTVLRAIGKLALQRNEWVVVFGQGVIGLLFSRLLRLRDGRVIAADLMESRLRMAKKMGARVTLNAARPDFITRVRSAANEVGADAAVVTVPGEKAVQQALAVTRPGAKVLLFAHTRRNDFVTVDAGAICLEERQIIGSYGSSPTLIEESARLVFQRRINARALVTHRFGIGEVDKAIQLASNPIEGVLKIIVRPQE